MYVRLNNLNRLVVQRNDVNDEWGDFCGRKGLFVGLITIDFLFFCARIYELMKTRQECVICTKMCFRVNIVKFLPCNHTFCDDFVRNFLRLDPRCPPCRTDIKEFVWIEHMY